MENAPNEKISEIRTTISDLEISLKDSESYRNILHRSLNEDAKSYKELQDRLEKEQKRSNRLLNVISKIDSSSENICSLRTSSSSHSSFNESQNATDTVSPLLMHYRYDELMQSYKRKVKLLNEKEILLHEILCERETIHDKYDDLMSEYKKLQSAMEKLCWKFLSFRTEKAEEISQVRHILHRALKLILKFYENDKDNGEMKEFGQLLQTLILVNMKRTSICDEN